MTVLLRRVGPVIFLLLGILYSWKTLSESAGLSGDKLFHVAVAVNYIDQARPDTQTVNSEDLSASDRLPFYSWRLAYSYFLAFILKYFRSVPDALDFIDFSTALIFFLSWFVILKSIPYIIDKKTSYALLSFWMFLYPPFLNHYVTDAPSLSLFSAGLAVALLAARFPKPSFFPGLVASLLFGGAALLRYLYFPVYAAVIFTFILLWKKDRGNFRNFIWGFGVGVLLVIGAALVEEVSEKQTLNFVSYNINEAKFPTEEPEQKPFKNIGIYWKSVFRTEPFISDYLGLSINFNTLFNRLGIERETRIFVYWLHFLPILFFAWMGWRRNRVTSSLPEYVFSRLATTVSTILFLFLFSLTVFIRTFDDLLANSRYYAPIALFLFVFLFSFFSDLIKKPKLKNRKVLATVALVVSLPVVLNLILWNLGKTAKSAACGYYNANLYYYEKFGHFDKLYNVLHAKKLESNLTFFIDDNPVRGAYLLFSGMSCVPAPEAFTSEEVTLLVIRSKSVMKSCNQFPYGLEEQTTSNLNYLIKQFSGGVVAESESWVVHALTVPAQSRFEIPESTDCLAR